MALSSSGLPAGISARPLRASDLDAALALSREAGWNQTAADWRIFLELGRPICLVRGSGAPIATAATLPFAGRFGWISMVLVTAAERRQGLAHWLLQRCIADLQARELVPALDATPAGRAVYAGLGFCDHWPMRRLIGRLAAAPQPGGSSAVRVRPIAPPDWPRLAAYDAAVFGAERANLLRRLIVRLPQAALVAERGDDIVGFVLGRDGRVMNQLGPLAAEDEEIARALLAVAMAAVTAPLVLDVPDRHGALGDWLAQLGFAVERPYMRMAHDNPAPFNDTARLFAIAGPELG